MSWPLQRTSKCYDKNRSNQTSCQAHKMTCVTTLPILPMPPILPTPHPTPGSANLALIVSAKYDRDLSQQVDVATTAASTQCCICMNMQYRIALTCGHCMCIGCYKTLSKTITTSIRCTMCNKQSIYRLLYSYEQIE